MNRKWTVQASTYPVNDRWLTVRADDCVTPEGVEIAPYYVLEYLDWVTVVPFDRNGNLILIRQYRHPVGAVTVELPSGRMDEGETDPVATAARELSEETGYQAGELRLLASHLANPSTHTNKVHTVLALDCVLVGDPQDDPTERIETEIVSRDQAIAMAQSGELGVSHQVASLLLALRSMDGD